MRFSQPIRKAIVRDRLATLLKLEPDIGVIGTTGDGSIAWEMVEKEIPDLVRSSISAASSVFC